MEDTKLEN